ncbi:hypothetical protein Ddye_005562 [Dipteronia dyeriana]|uniref:Uncharacterized protein n=1 Tax=Dipteronia dyeriana TaxID=168575 RepID=A0AAD9XGI0_9ROSI|nr:hypothetical protein Ddye_005562 [Dipteronia dyeriana]
MGYLDGTKPCPPATIVATTSTEQPSANPEHQIWLCQNRILHWNKLEVTYANRSNTHELRLLESLTNVTLADKFVADYMQGIKNILDNLELIGHSVNDRATIIHTLNGLGPTYLPLTSTIRARDTPITFEELYDKFLDHEAFLQCDEAKKGSLVLRHSSIREPSIEKAATSKVTCRTTWDTNSITVPLTITVITPILEPLQVVATITHPTKATNIDPHISHRSPLKNQWHPSTYNNNSQPICQLCDKLGHTTRVCHSRPSSES